VLLRWKSLQEASTFYHVENFCYIKNDRGAPLNIKVIKASLKLILSSGGFESYSTFIIYLHGIVP